MNIEIEQIWQWPSSLTKWTVIMKGPIEKVYGQTWLIESTSGKRVNHPECNFKDAKLISQVYNIEDYILCIKH